MKRDSRRGSSSVGGSGQASRVHLTTDTVEEQQANAIESTEKRAPARVELPHEFLGRRLFLITEPNQLPIREGQLTQTMIQGSQARVQNRLVLFTFPG